MILQSGPGSNSYKVIFSPSFTQEIKNQLLTQKNLGLIKSPHIAQRFIKLYEQHPFIRLLQYIHEISTLSLDIAHNNCPFILKALSIPNFVSLKFLELRFDNIQSIEELPFLKMGLLETLDIRDNRIIQSKGLNKTNWPQISTLHLGDNRFPRVNLDRVKISSQLKQLSVRNTCDGTSIISKERTIFIKLESKYLQSTFHKICCAQKNNKILQAICQKYLPIP